MYCMSCFYHISRSSGMLCSTDENMDYKLQGNRFSPKKFPGKETIIRTPENHGDCQGNGNISPHVHISQALFTQQQTQFPQAEENQRSKLKPHRRTRTFLGQQRCLTF